MLAGHIHFETALRYVALPMLVVKPNKYGMSTGDTDPKTTQSQHPAEETGLEPPKPTTTTDSSGPESENSEPTTTIKSSDSVSKTPKVIHTDLRAVFEWLRKNGVSKIVKLSVLDYGELSHRDSVIEKAVENLGIEVWDWKKGDICSEVIHKCAPSAREISLYWTGNHSVMMGWASAEGFHNQKKFPKVRNIPSPKRRGV